jgi:hypothetical protein
MKKAQTEEPFRMRLWTSNANEKCFIARKWKGEAPFLVQRHKEMQRFAPI